MATSTEESKELNYAEFKEQLEKLSKEMVKLDVVDVDLKHGILDSVLPAFGNILNTLMEKGTVQTRKQLLKWTRSHFMEMKKSMDSDMRVNAFLNPAIIRHFTAPEINTDSKTFQNLRQLSTLHNEILNPKYLDQNQFTIHVKTSENKILYSSTRHGRQVPLAPEIWDPIISAPTIRKLILDGNKLNNLLSSTTMIGGFNPLEFMAQISPYITTISIDLPGIYYAGDETIANLPDFLQQFANLKHLKLRTCKEWVASDLDQLEIFLVKIDNEISRELEIEFELCSLTDTNFLEIILSPERRFITKNHKVSLYHTSLSFRNGIQTRNWARRLTLVNKTSVLVKRFDVSFKFNLKYALAEKNGILNDLFMISKYVEDLRVFETFVEINNSLFTSNKWPRLKTLTIGCPTYYSKLKLTGLSSSCPNIEEIYLTIIESQSIFTNPQLTDEENLNHIFGNCANTLKRLSFKTAYFSFRSKLLQYLQELLPKTLVETERV